MTAKLIDLDAVVPDDLRVKLNGKTYKLPGDAPTELLLRLSLQAEKFNEAKDKAPEELLEMREELGGLIEDLFALRNDLEDGEIELTDRQVAELLESLFAIYFAVDGDTEEGGDRPTPPSTKSSRPSKRRSAAKGRRAPASSTSSQT